MTATTTRPVETTMALNELALGTGGNRFYRKLEDISPQPSMVGKSILFRVQTPAALPSGIGLQRVGIVFEDHTPIFDPGGSPVFQASFGRQGSDFVWETGPLQRSGTFHYFIFAELAYPEGVPSASGNTMSIVYPEMEVTDDPPG